eukprot:CAMPEP_0176202644 /NCGR_PEP_ID=MMETSP0121_2-20121125/10177_1 /TAXON_ID=160619 /ORGANISM="Kryptoperidinium foliaceum, Strain CCMP 1326" /LENGTH=148 /DNA_ID=CAMNT_0017541537 /DNA_START=70 /DNA_END=516 /DNA_ORIENTATION=+
MAPRLFVVAVLALGLAAPAAEGSALRHQRRADKFWPFSGTSAFAASSPAAPAAPRRSIQEVKDSVTLSKAFGMKTQALCQSAPEDEVRRCHQLAGHRLFCALLRRHIDRYEGMEGLDVEQEKCSRVDIMENAVEATKDEKLEEEAKEA